MDFKRSVAIVCHKLFDWRTGINPITASWYPSLYIDKKILIANPVIVKCEPLDAWSDYQLE